MKRVSSHISPEPVQADLQRGRPCPGDLKHPRSNPQARVRGDHLDTSDPFGDLSSVLRREGRPVCRVTGIKRSQPLAGSISQRLAGAEVREEVTVPLEDIELVRGRVFVIASEGPRTRCLGGVTRGEFQSANGDAEVKVAEDELDAGGSKSDNVPS